MNTLRLNSGRCKHLSQKKYGVGRVCVKVCVCGGGGLYFNDRLTLAVMFPKVNTELTSIYVLQFL